ncbi:Fc.00g097740.m01.CDS01 [Cosmosporella sp. VM-42]
MSNDITPATPPGLNAPLSNSICHLSIINTTCDIVVPTDSAVEPFIPGYKWLNLPTYSFYIKNETLGREVLFDLGMRKDWQNSVPHIRESVAAQINGLNIKKGVHEILAEGNIDLNNIEAFIMSHWHWDHCGAPSALPKSVKLIVGPGFRDAFLPGWPANAKSPFHEADFDGREVIEASFSEDFNIGQFQAYDYFGDGSLYVLNVPGHAIGHVGALVRTTPETFVFLGGDVCHSNGAIRPTAYIPMPDPIPEVTAFTNRLIASPCPCAAFSTCHPNQEQSRMSPFFKASTAPNSFYIDPATAQKSILALTEFDADPNVLVAIAHDPTALVVFDFFPNGSMNDWKRKGWKEASHWGFLEEFPYYGKVIQPVLTDGLYAAGKKIRGLDTVGA